jgi:alcohol dehydrogenase class IV
MNKLEANWNYPTDIRVGSGRSQELAAICTSIGMKSPLLITDPGLAALPMVDDAVESCRGAGLQCGLFTDVQGNPT